MERRQKIIAAILFVALAALAGGASEAQTIRCIPGLNCPEDRAPSSPLPTQNPTQPRVEPSAPQQAPPTQRPAPQPNQQPQTQPDVTQRPPAPTIAQTPVCPPVGTTLQRLNSERPVVFKGSTTDPFVCQIESSTGVLSSNLWFIWDLNNDQTRTNFITARSALSKLFPLKVGNTVNFDWFNGSTMWNNRFSVIGEERLIVGNEARDVWIVERERRGILNNNHHSIEIRHIDKITGAPLNLRIQLIRGTTESRDYTTTSLQGAGNSQTTSQSQTTRPTHTTATTISVSDIQVELSRLQLYSGQVDGALGPQTRAAIRRFQEQNGLGLTETVDEKLLSALRAAVARGPTRPPTAPEDPSRLVEYDGLWRVSGMCLLAFEANTDGSRLQPHTIAPFDINIERGDFTTVRNWTRPNSTVRDRNDWRGSVRRGVLSIEVRGENSNAQKWDYQYNGRATTSTTIRAEGVHRNGNGPNYRERQRCELQLVSLQPASTSLAGIERARAQAEQEARERAQAEARVKAEQEALSRLTVSPTAGQREGQTSARTTGRRVALVLGVGGYQHASPLRNPPNDAQKIAGVLRKAGFEVVMGIDLELREMIRLIRDFSRLLDGAEIGLFFYAGHGMQVAGENYILPTDAKLEREGDLAYEAVTLSSVLRMMETTAKVNLVFLDACRDNPLARSLARSLGTRSAVVGQGLAQVQSGLGTMVSYATQPGNVALDGMGSNSPFTNALATHLETPGLEIGLAMRRVREAVSRETGGRQVPWDHSSLVGEITLIASETPRPAPTQMITTPAPAPGNFDRESLFWQSALASSKREDFEAYLRAFPNGIYAPLARNRLGQQ